MNTKQVAAVAALMLATGWGTHVVHASDIPAQTTRTPVLLELFTSEGCSSCPPADKLLESLDRTQPFTSADLIVLSEHVDYWNHGGWSDPFSSAIYTKRQQDYVAAFDLDSGYTPQLVVDGKSELVGSNAFKAKRAIEQAAQEQKAKVNLSSPVRDGNQLRIHVDVAALPSDASGRATVYLALADNRAQSNVAGGENAGRSLQHVAVVRSLVAIGSIDGNGPFSKDLNLPLAHLNVGNARVVAFVQDAKSRHILGAAQQRL